MDIEDRYYELDNLISSLNIIIDETKSKDIVEDLQYMKYKYEDEKDNLENILAERQEKEERQVNYEYERSVL